MPFARWKNFDDCKLEQMQIGHDEESAGNICGAIQERAEKGLLFKALNSFEILKSADNELVVGGPASWEMRDYEDDIVTTEAQVNFLKKFFSLPEEYRNITIDHSNFQIAKALLQYPEENPRWFSHVHEKGMWLIAKIRDDNLTHTQHYRKLIRDGVYKMFSISGKPIRCDGPCEKHLRLNKLRKIFDIDPVEVGIVKEGMNSKSNFKILKTKCPPCVEHLRDKLMLKGLEEPEATDRAINLFNRVNERMEKEKTQKPKIEVETEKKVSVANRFESEIAHVYGEAAREALPELNLPEHEAPSPPQTLKERLESYSLALDGEKHFKKQFPKYKKGE
jgi:hypothetical protein